MGFLSLTKGLHYDTMVQRYIFILLVEMFLELDYCLRKIWSITLTNWDLIRRLCGSKVPSYKPFSCSSKLQSLWLKKWQKICSFLFQYWNRRPSSSRASAMLTSLDKEQIEVGCFASETQIQSGSDIRTNPVIKLPFYPITEYSISEWPYFDPITEL
jgi:hypothetical protein